MRESVSVLCPAKINLGLKVLDRRKDGYHNLQSIFTTVPLFDKMKVSVTESPGCKIHCKEMVLPEDNTISRAYKAFCVLTGIQKGVEVELTKAIPAGGGLGGGSSDASSFLKSIDNLFGTHLGLADLMQLSSLVGSDVFFFTKALVETDNYSKCAGYTALVEGRGEVVKTISYRNDFTVLLLLPGTEVSTKEAYGALDSFRERSKVSCSDMDFLEEWKKRPTSWLFKNDFTEPVCEFKPDLKIALEKLKATEADFTDMSGSGSTLFAVYEDSEKAIRAQKSLSEQYKSLVLHQ